MPKKGQPREATHHWIRDVVAESVQAAMERSESVKTALQLAARAKVGRRTVNRLLARKNSTLDTLGAVADALDKEPFELLLGKRKPPLLHGSERRPTEEKVTLGAGIERRDKRIKNA